MKVCVLAGSPRGKYSITYQTVRFLEKKFPEDSFNTVHVGQRIKAIEKDMTDVLAAIADAELLLFCYPVYTFIAPYQLHKFIRMLKESGADLSGKFAAQVTTSKHFYDVTAHKYVEHNCADLGLPYLGGLSADADDLLTEKGRADAVAFWELIKFRKASGLYAQPVKREEKPREKYVPSGVVAPKSSGKQAVIVAALEEGDDELAAMIKDFSDAYPYESKLVNLNEYPFSGGCLGCLNCAVDGTCVYKDGFDAFLRNEIQTGSAIIYAFRVQDHSMGPTMKLYDDRQFCNGHRTVTAGMPMGYLVCGDLDSEPDLKMIIEGRSQVGGNFLAGVATDAQGVTDLVKSLEYAIDNKLTQPSNFLGVGGMKIFRDLIWLMRGMMRADHKFYKKHKLYDDFPQKKRGTVLKIKLVGALLANPKIKAKLGNKMNEGMLAPYNKILDKMDT